MEPIALGVVALTVVTAVLVLLRKHSRSRGHLTSRDLSQLGKS